MPLEAWATLGIVVAMLAVLATDRLPPAMTVLGAMVILLVTGIIDDSQAFAGFSNPAPLTVAALYVVAKAADKTGLLGPVVVRLLGNVKTGGREALSRIVLPTAGLSAFINNTPVVAMLIPEITAWCAKRDISPSRLLLPLSYAAILGGTVTVIGTSTNLVVSGLLVESGQDPLGLFEITKIGGLAALAGLVVTIVLIPILVPERKGASVHLSDDEVREFTIEMEVEPGGRLDGTTVEDGGLRHLKGVYLVEVERDGGVIAPVAPTTQLEGSDRLTFAGRADVAVDLQRVRGLRSTADKHLLKIGQSPRHTFYEAVVGGQSRLVGRTLKEIGFRGRYQAAVVAIHRAGERLETKLGDVRLRSGDTLIMLAGPDFRSRWREGRDFLVVARLGGPPPQASRKAPLVGLLAISVIGLAAFEVLPILHAALLAAGVLILTRVLTFNEALDAIDLNVILLIAAAFGVGSAIESTGLAGELATGLLNGLDGFGDIGLILAVVIATSLLTEIVTNNAAAVVVFPIAIAVAVGAGLDPRILAMAVAVTASCSFLTPLGYQTNTMVYGPGGYRFIDYLRTGTALNLTTVTVITLVTWQLM